MGIPQNLTPFLVGFEGIICGYAFAVANVDERDVLPEMVAGLPGLLIGDKGYIRPRLKHETNNWR